MREDKLKEVQLKEAAKRLSVTDVTKFLKIEAKLEKYTVLFEENDIDGAILFNCTNKSLADLGIANDFHCTKIIVKFEKYLQDIISVEPA